MSSDEIRQWPTEAVAGVILAGGRSRRMGRDKAAVLYRGRRLVDIAFAQLTQAGLQYVIVSGPDKYDLAAKAVPDSEPGRGPVAGLVTVMRHCIDRDDLQAILTVPVDCPLMTGNVIRQLIAPDRPAILTGPDGPHPTFGFWPLRLFSAIERYFETDSNPSLQGWAAVSGAAEIPVHSSELLVNINWPEDLTNLSTRRGA